MCLADDRKCFAELFRGVDLEGGVRTLANRFGRHRSFSWALHIPLSFDFLV
jgi:hypothetical protein